MQSKQERNARARARRAQRRAEKLDEIATKYVTSTELKKDGWSRGDIAQLGEPDLVRRVGWADRFHWRRDRVAECKPRQRRTTKPPALVDLLQAISAVNRAAKRRRDTASINYRKGRHGAVAKAKEEKENLYALKDKGIAVAYLAGRLRYEGRHASLAIYRGGDYCFHSTLLPATETDLDVSDDGGRIFIESKPKTSREGRLCDAVFTLTQLPESSENDFEILDAPSYPKRQRPRVELSGKRRWEEEWADSDRE